MALSVSTGRHIDMPLMLFGIEVLSTPAHHRVGSITVRQCAKYGVLVAIPDYGTYQPAGPLGACPRCGHNTWWRQRFPVGALAPPTPASADEGTVSG
jgi:hypothetical protein